MKKIIILVIIMMLAMPLFAFYVNNFETPKDIGSSVYNPRWAKVTALDDTIYIICLVGEDPNGETEYLYTIRTKDAGSNFIDFDTIGIEPKGIETPPDIESVNFEKSVVVAWPSSTDNDTLADIIKTRFSADGGASWDDTIGFVSYSNGRPKDLDLGSDKDQHFCITWSDNDTSIVAMATKVAGIQDAFIATQEYDSPVKYVPLYFVFTETEPYIHKPRAALYMVAGGDEEYGLEDWWFIYGHTGTSGEVAFGIFQVDSVDDTDIPYEDTNPYKYFGNIQGPYGVTPINRTIHDISQYTDGAGEWTYCSWTQENTETGETDVWMDRAHFDPSTLGSSLGAREDIFMYSGYDADIRLSDDNDSYYSFSPTISKDADGAIHVLWFEADKNTDVYRIVARTDVDGDNGYGDAYTYGSYKNISPGNSALTSNAMLVVYAYKDNSSTGVHFLKANYSSGGPADEESGSDTSAPETSEDTSSSSTGSGCVIESIANHYNVPALKNKIRILRDYFLEFKIGRKLTDLYYWFN